MVAIRASPEACSEAMNIGRLLQSLLSSMCCWMRQVYVDMRRDFATEHILKTTLIA